MSVDCSKLSLRLRSPQSLILQCELTICRLRNDIATDNIIFHEFCYYSLSVVLQVIKLQEHIAHCRATFSFDDIQPASIFIYYYYLYCKCKIALIQFPFYCI